MDCCGGGCSGGGAGGAVKRETSWKTATPMLKQTKQRRKNLRFSSPLIINMGCEVTSVYNDEIVGKMGFSQTILDDLLDRDFRTASPMPELELKAGIANIEGFTQSFATGRLYFAVVGEQECTVSSAGRFIVIEELKSRRRKFIGNRDVVSAFDVREKLCLVGLSGGYLVLWDLEFLEVKLQVMLPEGSLTVTTVSLTPKFLFATDASQPNSLVFCYDIRTAKLKASALIPSLEPAVRSISVGDDTHATSCADGVWFTQMERSSNQLKVTRGMFGHFPKTSMACLAQAGGYVISGGVDGYIYAWKMTSLRCTKALKVHEGEITAMTVKNGQVVVACMSGRVKIYSFKVTKNEKKGPVARIEEEEDRPADEDNQVLTFVLMDTYEKEGSVFSIAHSQKDPLLYYCQTRQGLLFQKRLPAIELAPSNKSLATVEFEDISRINGKAHVSLHDGKVYSLYLMTEKLLFMDVHRVDKGSLSLIEERVAKLQASCDGKHLAYLPNSNEVAYLSKNNKIMVAETFGKIGDALLNVNQSNFGQNTREVLTIAAGEEVLSLNFIYSEGHSFLVVNTSSSVHVFEREGRLAFQEKHFSKYEKEAPSAIEVGGRKLVFEEGCGKWRDEREEWRPLPKEEQERQEKLLCCKPKSTDSRWNSAGLIMGQGYAIFQK